MKRSLITFIFILFYFISVSTGLASFLTTEPSSVELEPGAQIQQNHTEKLPIAIAGGSWGGIRDGSDDDEQKNPPPKKPDQGGVRPNGGSWGG